MTEYFVNLEYYVGETGLATGACFPRRMTCGGVYAPSHFAQVAIFLKFISFSLFRFGLVACRFAER